MKKKKPGRQIFIVDPLLPSLNVLFLSVIGRRVGCARTGWSASAKETRLYRLCGSAVSTSQPWREQLSSHVLSLSRIL